MLTSIYSKSNVKLKILSLEILNRKVMANLKDFYMAINLYVV